MSAKTNRARGLLKFTSLHCRNRGRSGFPTEPSKPPEFALRANARRVFTSRLALNAVSARGLFFDFRSSFVPSLPPSLPPSLSLSLSLSLSPESRRSLRNPSIYIERNER